MDLVTAYSLKELDGLADDLGRAGGPVRWVPAWGGRADVMVLRGLDGEAVRSARRYPSGLDEPIGAAAAVEADVLGRLRTSPFVALRPTDVVADWIVTTPDPVVDRAQTLRRLVDDQEALLVALEAIGVRLALFHAAHEQADGTTCTIGHLDVDAVAVDAASNGCVVLTWRFAGPGDAHADVDDLTRSLRDALAAAGRGPEVADAACSALFDAYLADRHRRSGVDFSPPPFGARHDIALRRCLDSGDISFPDGATARLERAVASRLGVEGVIAHGNGTSAMFSAMAAVGVEAGDQVVVPTYTWWASASPALWLGAEVVFADVGERLTVDVDSLVACLGSRTRAVVVPHLWGEVAPVEQIVELCHERGIAVIEDASHVFGCRRRAGASIGTIGDVGIFSLQANKPLRAGEGGLLVTDDAALFDRALVVGHYERLAGRTLPPELAALSRTGLGLKFRMSPLHASLALENLETFEAEARLQDVLVRSFTSAIPADVGQVLGTTEGVEYGGRTGLRLVLAEPFHAEAVVPLLQEAGVPATHDHFFLLHREALFASDIERRPTPVADRIVDRIVALPLPWSGTSRAIDDLAAGVVACVRRARP